MTNVPLIETSQLICRANQLIDFYIRGTLVVKGLSCDLHLVGSVSPTVVRIIDFFGGLKNFMH